MTFHLHDFSNRTHMPRLNTVSGPRSADHICILMGLCNGASMLPAQLNSLAAQSHRDWSLIVSDDGSDDNWLNALSSFGDRHAPGRTWIARGPRRGFAANFLHLLALAGPMTPYAAFCDQDDVWLPHKLARALAHLKTLPATTPSLYVSRTMVCDADLGNRRPSWFCREFPSSSGPCGTDDPLCGILRSG